MLTHSTIDNVVKGILEWMNEVAEELVEEGLITEEKITTDTKPGVLTTSHILAPKLISLEAKLNIEIPNSCYPFYNYKTHQQLTIKQAAEILIKRANHAR